MLKHHRNAIEILCSFRILFERYSKGVRTLNEFNQLRIIKYPVILNEEKNLFNCGILAKYYTLCSRRFAIGVLRSKTTSYAAPVGLYQYACQNPGRCPGLNYASLSGLKLINPQSENKKIPQLHQYTTI